MTDQTPKPASSGEALSQPLPGENLLAPAWQSRVRERQIAAPPAEQDLILPRSPEFYAGSVTLVDNPETLQALLDLARQRRLGHIGIDTEFSYSRPGVAIDDKHTRYDIRSVRPMLLSLALVELASDDGGMIYKFVVDLRQRELRSGLQQLLNLPVLFVGHFLKAELFCFWQLGLREPRMIWDSWVHETAINLGRHHVKYRQAVDADEAEIAATAAAVEEEQKIRLGLVPTCQRYGVPHDFASDKEQLQSSFLSHPDDQAFNQQQLNYAAADAVAAARLYPPQVLRATQEGILDHLKNYEMPWTTTSARMEWHGVTVDADKCGRVGEAIERHVAALEPQLAEYGIDNHRSHQQLRQFVESVGLLPLFHRGGEVSFKKDLLKEHAHRHPALAIVRSLRKAEELRGGHILNPQFAGQDGRVHPDYRQLGAHTGRQTCRCPNVLGLGKLFRPLIVAAPGYRIGEVDLCQIEVGVVGAVSGDEALIQMFNSGDVYSKMAQTFYTTELTDADRELSPLDFKLVHQKFRDAMKTCTLGMIYGLSPHGLAMRLEIPKWQAESILNRFLDMFPDLRRWLETEPIYAQQRGYALTHTGLRRHRGDIRGDLGSWERNWMRNHPIQGSAATVFKDAGNRLDRLYRHYEAKLIIPMHDAFVFEAPEAVFGEVAELTEQVMCDVVQEHFPVLRPQVEANISHPECWNKDGHHDSIERWIEDPLYMF
jgi:DNA polymerase-1